MYINGNEDISISFTFIQSALSVIGKQDKLIVANLENMHNTWEHFNERVKFIITDTFLIIKNESNEEYSIKENIFIKDIKDFIK